MINARIKLTYSCVLTWQWVKQHTNILCTTSLAIAYVSHLYVLIFVQCRAILNAMTKTGP